MKKGSLFLLCAANFAAFLICASMSAQEITITSPVEGDQWKVGTSHKITWTSSGYEGKKLTIETSDQYYAIADEVPVELGEYDFTIPWEIKPNEKFSIVLKIAGVQKSSVQIVLAENTSPALQIQAPMGKEAWALDKSYVVAWEPHNLQGNIKIELLKDGATVDTVEGIPVSDTRYAYTVPKTFEAGVGYSVRISSASDPSLISESGTFTIVAEAPIKKKWTILFYLDGDCNLEKDIVDNICSLNKIGSNVDINFIYQLDRVPGYSTQYGNWYGTKRFYLTQDMTPTPENAVQDLGELNMGSPDTLTNFINWGIENYPAEKYFLILADHGSGWNGGVCGDYTSENIDISTRQMQEALDNAAGKITILGIDTCLEGYLEIAYQVRNSGPKIMIASQYQESSAVTYESPSWPYITIFSKLQQNPDIDEKTLSALVCEDFVKKFIVKAQTDTLSATDLSKVDDLTAKIADFAKAMIADYKDKSKIKAQAEIVKRAFRETVFHYASTQSLEGKVFGLNINFPTSKESAEYIKYNSDVVAFPVPSSWKDFLTAYIDNMKGSWIEEARLASSGGDIEESADLYNFCNHLSPNDDEVRLTVLANGKGSTAPVQGETFVKKGKQMNISAIPSRDPQYLPLCHFVRWIVSGNAVINDIYSAETTLIPSGDTMIIAVFYEDKDKYMVNFSAEGNGSLTGSLTQEVASGGSCTAISAVPQAGYVFLGWGGDHGGFNNPLTLTNVQMDMNVLAFFGAPSVVTVKNLKFTFNNSKSNIDKISVVDGTYPDVAPTTIESASVTINGVLFDCPSGAGWVNSKPGVYNYNSGKKSQPEIQLKIDTVKKLWTFSSAKADANAKIIPQDNIEIILGINGENAAKINLDYVKDLVFKSSVNYKRPRQ